MKPQIEEKALAHGGRSQNLPSFTRLDASQDSNH